MNSEVKVLTSWQEIAAYLGKGVRTVQRWEKVLGLPVQRPTGSPRGIVLASVDDLEEWLARGWSPHQPIRTTQTQQVILDEHKRLRQANRDLTRELRQTIQALKFESAALARSKILPH